MGFIVSPSVLSKTTFISNLTIFNLMSYNSIQLAARKGYISGSCPLFDTCLGVVLILGISYWIAQGDNLAVKFDSPLCLLAEKASLCSLGQAAQNKGTPPPGKK